MLIQPRLRDSAQMTGEVDVLGQQSFLEVWNHERLVAQLSREPFTDDDAKALSDSGFERMSVIGTTAMTRSGSRRRGAVAAATGARRHSSSTARSASAGHARMLLEAARRG